MRLLILKASARAIAGVVLLLGLANDMTQAQYRAPKVYNPRVYDGTRRTMSNRTIGRTGTRDTNGKATNPNSPASKSTTSFEPAPPSTMPSELAIKYASNPDEQQRLEQLFSGLLDDYRTRLRKNGAEANDVTFAAAYLASVGYTVSQNRAPLSADEHATLRKRVSEVLSTDERFQRLSNRDRQDLFEKYAITAAWVEQGYNATRESVDRKNSQHWRQMARHNFEALLGFKPESVIITSSALEFK